MNKKLFDSLDESLKEKLKNCKSDAEIQKVIAEAGLQELSGDMLEGVSGGQDICRPFCYDDVVVPIEIPNPDEK